MKKSQRLLHQNELSLKSFLLFVDTANSKLLLRSKSVFNRVSDEDIKLHFNDMLDEVSKAIGGTSAFAVKLDELIYVEMTINVIETAKICYSRICLLPNDCGVAKWFLTKNGFPHDPKRLIKEISRRESDIDRRISSMRGEHEDKGEDVTFRDLIQQMQDSSKRTWNISDMTVSDFVSAIKVIKSKHKKPKQK